MDRLPVAGVVGLREVHDDTPEGIGTGLRNYLRMFRGVSKHYLARCVAVFLRSDDIKTATDDFLRAPPGVRVATDHRT